ncbi:MAG: MBOAT family protein [Lachnospiraceae bacterium]|nr:MBOAT family protein [Lachnospiraceae bacterium]
MLFTSYAFIGFLCAGLIIYRLAPVKVRPYVLLALSYYFYAHAGLWCVIFIFSTSVVAYLVTLKMDRMASKRRKYLMDMKDVLSREEAREYKAKNKRSRRRVLIVGLVLTLGLLAVVKYTDFTITNINSLLDLVGSESRIPLAGILMPMGISFYIFSTVGYMVDVYREAVQPTHNPFHTALFISFFPQLVQGPISRYGDIKEDLFDPKPLKVDSLKLGALRVLWGFAKKLIIADRALVAVKAITGDPGTYSGSYVVAGMALYALELYADFTGGIDITIGAAQMFGIGVRENFVRPYFSKNVAEYWRRWHITMGTWFADYVFYPMSSCKLIRNISGALRRSKLPRRAAQRIPVYITSAVVWFATGLWHGASWNFILWGMLNFAVIMISQELEPLYAKFHAKFDRRFTFSRGEDDKRRIRFEKLSLPERMNRVPYKVFSVTRTIVILSCLRMLDCYGSVGITFKAFGSIFTSIFSGGTPAGDAVGGVSTGFAALFDGSMFTLGLTGYDYLILLIGMLTLFTVSMVQRKGSVRARLFAAPFTLRAGVVIALFVAVIIFGAYGPGYDVGQFIYNRF